MNIFMTDGHWDDVVYARQVCTPEAGSCKTLFTYICEWDEQGERSFAADRQRMRVRYRQCEHN